MNYELNYGSEKRKVQLIINVQVLCTAFWPFPVYACLFPASVCIAYFYFFCSFLFHSWSTQIPLSAGSLLKVPKPQPGCQLILALPEWLEFFI